jgi:transcription antitermination factor NusG
MGAKPARLVAMNETNNTLLRPGQRESYPWYVVRVRPNSEWKTTESLTVRGYEVFLPLCRRVREKSRRRVLDVPLFPGYVFCRFDRRNLTPIMSATGVVQVLTQDHKPEAVQENEIFALQSMARARMEIEPWPTFETGQKIKIRYGPLAGVEGHVVRDAAKPRLVISVSLLHRSVVTQINREYLELLPRQNDVIDLPTSIT